LNTIYFISHLGILFVHVFSMPWTTFVTVEG